jgi:hypothetical protein
MACLRWVEKRTRAPSLGTSKLSTQMKRAPRNTYQTSFSTSVSCKKKRWRPFVSYYGLSDEFQSVAIEFAKKEPLGASRDTVPGGNPAIMAVLKGVSRNSVISGTCFRPRSLLYCSSKDTMVAPIVEPKIFVSQMLLYQLPLTAVLTK